MIVQYYSDSLGLARPGHVELNNTYIYIFEKWLRDSIGEDVHLINRARRAFTIDKLYEVFKEDEEYIHGEKDVLIIHEGVCDCAPRPVSKGLRRIISMLPGFIKIRIISFLHKNRSTILRHGWRSYLVSKKEFERVLHQWLSEARMTFKRIYVLTIAPTNLEIETHSPGFSASINCYNNIIKQVVKDLNNDKIQIIDVYSFINSLKNIDDYIIKEDGHHITAKTHQLIAESLIGLEKSWGK